MRKRIIIPVLGTVGAIVLALGFAAPASADSGGTPVTLEVAGGGLSITVPTGTVSLGSVNESAVAQSVTANLGSVTVTDTRGGTTGWAVSASANDFVGPQSISVNGPSTSSYTSPAAVTTGAISVTPSDLAGLYPGGIVQTGANAVGANSATWDPTISVLIPGAALAGTYSSVLTHSVN